MAAGNTNDDEGKAQVMRHLRDMSAEAREKLVRELVQRLDGAPQARPAGAQLARDFVRGWARDDREALGGLEVRPTVAALAQLMEAKLRHVEYTKRKDGWRGDDPKQHMDGVYEETSELARALHLAVSSMPSPREYLEVALEAADVANTAMMVADCAGVLPLDGRALTGRGELDQLQASTLGGDASILQGFGNVTFGTGTQYNPAANATATMGMPTSYNTSNAWQAAQVPVLSERDEEPDGAVYYRERCALLDLGSDAYAEHEAATGEYPDEPTSEAGE